LCFRNLFYEENERKWEGKGRKVKKIHVLENFLGEKLRKERKQKENKDKFPSKTFLPHLGGKEENERK